MEEKISAQAIGQYSEEYAAKLTDPFFKKKDFITGPEILLLSEIKQVNLFVIRELMHVWKQEAEKLKSPYFDYSAKEVQNILLQFQNTISNHISISKQNIKPLLESSITKTIYLILAPYDFYSDTLDRHGKGYIKTEFLKNEVRYLKVNKAPLEKLVEKLESQKLELITGNEAFGLLDTILEEVNFTPEDFENYLTQFSKLVPLKMEQLFGQKPSVKVESKPEQVKAIPVPQKENVIPSQAKTSLADTLAKQKVIRLKDSLTINQKFMFTKILFKGDFEIFSEAMDRIDGFETLNHALAHIGDTYADWDRESEEYEEFIEVLEKRFGQG